ncbi:MAG: Abi-alpha family protein [Methylomicrobium sp.]
MSNELETIQESAKAVQEAAKTASNAIDAGREVGGFISRFLSGPLEQGIGIIEDKLRYVRWERQVRFIMRAEEFLKQQGLSRPSKTIPLKNAVPLLEYATLEEDDNLQDMWARLLVNGTNEATGINIERSFIEILGQISSLEAQILNAIYALPFDETKHDGVYTENLPEFASVAEETPENDLKEPSQEVQLALANLARIGCLKLTLTWGGGEIFSRVNPTLIGKELVKACTFQNNEISQAVSN